MRLSAANSFVAPKQLGRYAVGAKIGGGGMATVYVGTTTQEDDDEDPVEERVALKVIRPELASDPQFHSMFEDEAKILAGLSHPNIIRTLEYGTTGAHSYIAMELLSGRTYADLWDVLAARGETMPLRLGAWICARVAEGLHSAHDLVDEGGQPLNVIHRDVNPSNIFLTHGGDVKLIDFGLAKARVRVSKSADGIVKGKIPYLAPEQAHGKAIDRRIDVYALGTTLWETCTMKRLFKRETDVDTLKAIRDAVVPNPAETIDNFPGQLWKIIQKALESDPDERYTTAAAMREDLDAYVGDDADMHAALAKLVSESFPGDEEKHEQWLRDATSLRTTKGTLPPPHSVPMASSSLLEDVDSDPALEAKPKIDTPEAEAKTEATKPEPPPLERPANPKADEKKAEPKEADGLEKRKTDDKKPKPKAKEAAAPSPSTQSATKMDPPKAAAALHDPAEQKRLWTSIATVLAVLGVLYYFFGR